MRDATRSEHSSRPEHSSRGSALFTRAHTYRGGAGATVDTRANRRGARGRRLAPLVLSTLAALATTTAVHGQAAPSPVGDARALTVEDWRADLAELADHVRENHRDPYHSISAAELDAAIGDLDRRLPDLGSEAIVTEMARLVASIGDGHTRLTLPVNPANLGYSQGHTPDPEPGPGVERFHTLPVRFGDFEEGVHVTAATSDLAHLIGSRLVRIGGLTAEEALEAVGPFIAHDTPAGLRFHATKLLSVPEILVAAGGAGDALTTDLVVETRDGDERALSLPWVGYDDAPAWVDPEAHLVQGPDTPYFSIVEDPSGTLVVTVYQINDSPTEAIGAFSRRLSEAIRRHEPARVILDIRRCHGGDQSLGRALVLPFIRWEKATTPGHLFALVGPETFSAAVNLASRLEEWTQVTFVGEPLGSGPSHYSSSDREVLDRSNLVVRVSTGYFVGWTGSEWRESVEIGVPARPRIADFLAGEDTAMRAALAFRLETGVAEQLIGAHERAGINAALILWSRYRTDPATAGLSLEAAGNAFARHLLETGETRFAAAIFLFNREFYPDSIDAYVGEAEARLELGEREQALAILEEALEKSPGHPAAESLRARIGREGPRAGAARPSR